MSGRGGSGDVDLRHNTLDVLLFGEIDGAHLEKLKIQPHLPHTWAEGHIYCHNFPTFIGIVEYSEEYILVFFKVEIKAKRKVQKYLKNKNLLESH